MSDQDYENTIWRLDKRIAELEAKVAEHEYRWKWLNGSILALSKEGYSEWASVVLAVINKCRYEDYRQHSG